MERDGLLHVADHRQLALTETGRALAMRVVRKNRLAECLLADVLKLPLPEAQIEACRWEHVMSEGVERRLVELLGHPTTAAPPRHRPTGRGRSRRQPDVTLAGDRVAGSPAVEERATGAAEEGAARWRSRQVRNRPGHDRPATRPPRLR